jgi:hypothetical protein
LYTEAGQLFDELSAVLVDTAAALDAHDPQAAQDALQRARDTDPAVSALGAALGVGQDTSRLDPLRRRRLGTLRRYEELVREVDRAVRNTRVLARAVVVVTRGPVRPPAAIAESVRQLATAVTALSADLRAPRDDTGSRLRWPGPGGRDGPGTAAGPPTTSAVQNILAAVRTAGSGLTDDSPLPVAAIVWQVRSTAVDLLRGTGMELATVLDLVDGALDATGTPG